MAKTTYNICVLIVTYGNRWQFLEQVLTRVLTFENVKDILVVDNASVYSVAENCGRLADQRINVITNADNLGSAGGYKQGLEHFYHDTSADFVWLLDDDNQPAIAALDELIDSWPSIAGSDDSKALFSLRPDRKQHVKIAGGEDASRFFAIENSFMGFHLFRIPLNQLYKLRDRFIKPGAVKNKAWMPYVPYGGLFLHRRMVSLIGYPEESFFVYADDSEYTYRITKNGGKIWLIPASQVRDVDTSYGTSYKQHFWRSVYLDLWSFRTYYQVRNSVYFHDRVQVTNRTLYDINRWLFLKGQLLISKLSGKEANYTKLLKAVEDGLTGRLGVVNPEKYN